MKTKIKLIPLTALATAAAVTTPLAVSSCAKQNETFDLTHGYIPEIEQHSGDFVLSQYKATTAYVQFAKENPEALIKDLAYGAANQWQEIFSRFGGGSSKKDQTYNLTANQISFSATQPTFGTAKIQFAGEEPLEYPTISFTTTQKIDCKLTYKPAGLSTTLSADYDYQFDIVTEYKDVVFFACPFNAVRKMVGRPAFEEEDIDPTGRTWYISFLDGSMAPEAIIANSNPWSINASANVVAHTVAKDTSGKVITDTTDTSKVSTEINSIISLSNLFDLEYEFLSAVIAMEKGDPQALTKWRQYYDMGMMLWGATLNHKSYYLDNMYHAPSVVNSMRTGMYQGTYMPLSNNYRNGEYIEPEQAEDISLNLGLEYVMSLYTAQDRKVDIGNVNLILDDPIYLPKATSMVGETPKFIQIGEAGVTEYPILVWPKDWTIEDPIPPVSLPAKLVVKDEQGAYVPSGYTVDEIKQYGIEEIDSVYSMDFKINKKQLTIEIPVYEQLDDGTWKLIDTITSIIDIRTNLAQLWFDIAD